MTMSRQKVIETDTGQYSAKVVSGKPDEHEAVALRVVIRAEYGTRSFCTIRGLENDTRLAHLVGNTSNLEPIEITPLTITRLIEAAHERGWNPSEDRTNFEMMIDNEEFLAIARSRG